jgi:hypothetical protein
MRSRWDWSSGYFGVDTMNSPRVIRIFVVVVVIAAMVAGFCIYQGVSASLHAEHVLHAALLTVQLLDEYVVLNDGQWPHSWSDLEKLPPKHRGGMFSWPEDSTDVQKYVELDFSANPQNLAKQSANQFDAVRPIGPYYEFKDYGSVEALLKSIRTHGHSDVEGRKEE